MPQIINTNISSLTAQRNLNKSQGDQATALQRLSSGLRINSAKDDAAGLAISTRFTSQTKGLSVAIRNAGDGISLAQTAEGALGSMTDSLQRVRELALQAANGTNSDTDREALNAEAQQLISEITRTGEQTNFNGRKLLDGSFDSAFQIGANAGETIEVSVAKMTSDTLGSSAAAGVSAIGTERALSNGDLIINGTAITPSSSADDDSSTVDAASSAIAKAEAINRHTDETGVTATVLATEATGTTMAAATTAGTATINGVDIALSTGASSATDNRNSVISAINAKSDQTGVVAEDGGDSGGVILKAADGRNIDVDLTTAGNLTAASTGLTDGTSYGGVTLTGTGAITVSGGDGTGNGDIANAGMRAGTYQSGEAVVNSSQRATGEATIVDSTTTKVDAGAGVTAGTGTLTEQGTSTTAAFDFGTTPLVLDSTNNTFNINVDGNGNQLITLTDVGDGQIDDMTEFKAAIDAALTAAGGDAATLTTAIVGGGSDQLEFTSATQGTGSSVVITPVDNSFQFPDLGAMTEVAVGATTNATDGTYDTGNMNIVDPTLVNATNNTFNLSVDGGDFVTITLDSSFLPTAGATSTAGEYEDAAELAEFMNNAIASSSLNTFVTAAANGTNDGIVFTSTSGGAGSSVLATSGTIAVPNTTTASAVDGADGGAFEEVTLGFVFDDNLPLTVGAGGDNLDVTVDGGTLADLDITADDYTTAQDFADELNTQFGVESQAVTARVSDDGTQVILRADNAGETLLVAAGGTPITQGAFDDVVSHVDSKAVLTATNSFIDAVSGTNEVISLNVDGVGPVDVELGDAIETAYDAAFGGAGAYDADLLAATSAVDDSADQATKTATFLDRALSVQAAGSGVTVAAVGDQVTFTSDTPSTGSVVLAQGSANPLSAAINVTTPGSVTDNVLATSGEVQTGTLAIPTTITDGVNDKFSISLDGSNYVEVDMDGSDFDPLVDGVDMNAFALWMDDQVTNSGVAVGVSVNDAGDGLKFTDDANGAASRVRISDGFDSLTPSDDGAFAITGNTQTSGVDGSTATSSQTFTVDNLDSTVVGDDIQKLVDGDLVINGTAVGAADANDDTASDTTALSSDGAASGIATAAAINKATDSTGVTATVNATVVTGGDAPTATPPTSGTGTIHINGVEAGSVVLTNDADKNRAAAIDAINSVSGQTGVTAEDNGVSITMTAADGRNLSVAIDNNGEPSGNIGSAMGLDSTQDGIAEADFDGGDYSYANVAATTYSSVELSSSGEIEVTAGSNGADDLENLEFDQGSFGASERGTFISDIDISTLDGANAALTALDNALNSVSSERANLGAIQNRFETTISNLEITSENLTAANSRIKDADFATETAELARTQVLQQAGISILAQANALPQQALSLLQ